jgi:antitoxin CptB
MSDPDPSTASGPNPSPSPGPLDPRRRRILFRATHRGTHENDLLVGGYVAPRLATMSEAELDAVEAIMELPDPSLADWLTGRQPVPSDHDSPLLRAMVEDALVRAGAANSRGMNAR